MENAREDIPQIEQHREEPIPKFEMKTFQFSCSTCQASFHKKWFLKRHENHCKFITGLHKKLRKDDGYPCKVCNTKVDSMWAFKTHVFENHIDHEVIPHYGNDVEKLLSSKFLETKRQVVLNKLGDGKFDNYVLKLMNKDKEISSLPYKTHLGLHEEEDNPEIKLRFEAYLKKLTLFHNLAANVEGQLKLKPDDLFDITNEDGQTTYRFNLRQNLSNEFNVLRLQRPLKYCQIANRENLSILPKFEALERHGSEVTLKLKSNGTCLRSYLDDRQKVDDYADVLVSCLLDGLLKLQEKEWVTRCMWPSVINVLEDQATVQFTDLTLMCDVDTVDNWWTDSPIPYSLYFNKQRRTTEVSLEVSDWFAVGVILLEILVGSKIVLSLNVDVEVYSLHTAIQGFIDKETWRVIEALLYGKTTYDLKGYVHDYLPRHPNALW